MVVANVHIYFFNWGMYCCEGERVGKNKTKQKKSYNDNNEKGNLTLSKI